jgi:hypothetical protein
MQDEKIEAVAVKGIEEKTDAVAVKSNLAPGRFGTAGSPINVLKVQSIKLPVWTGKDVETTGMSDSNDTYTPGVPNFGEADVDVIYLATQAASIKALRNVPATFVVTYTNGQIDTFTGWINSLGNEIAVREKIMQKFKVRASSDVTSTGTVTGTVPIIGLGTTLTITSI